MTKEEIIKYLSDELEEELEGIVKYNEVYEAAVAIGMYHEARIIEKITNEEYTHASVLQTILDMHHYSLPETSKIPELWAQATSVFHGR